MYNSVIARKFRSQVQKSLKYGAIIWFLLIALFFCTFFKPYLDPQRWNYSHFQIGVDLRMLRVNATSSSQKLSLKNSIHQNNKIISEKTQPVLCTTNERRTDFCEIRSKAAVDANSSLVFAISPSQKVNTSLSITIRPYARKEDHTAMGMVSQWSAVLRPAESHRENPKCTQNHTVPAMLFSLGGYIGNNYHDFFDVLIPLFITTRKFNGEVKFLITDYKQNFTVKFRKVLKGLSKYEPIKIDKETQQVHCFPSVIIGLKRNPNGMNIDAMKHSPSLNEFRVFLRSSYSLNRDKIVEIGRTLRRKKPHLLILSRKRTRTFENERAIRAMAKSLGYRVTISEAISDLERFSGTVNSCDVMMGVHGAGLANIFFLPRNAVFIQVVPFGDFEWIAKEFYGQPSIDMNLHYLEYKISKEESTLTKQYPVDHAVFSDPHIIQSQGWDGFKRIYMENQNVSVDVNRFKPTLVKALKLLHGN